MLPYHTRPACPAEYVPLLFSTFFSQKRAGQAKFFQNIFYIHWLFDAKPLVASGKPLNLHFGYG